MAAQPSLSKKGPDEQEAQPAVGTQASHSGANQKPRPCEPIAKSVRTLVRFHAQGIDPALQFSVVEAPGSSMLDASAHDPAGEYQRVHAEIWAQETGSSCTWARSPLGQIAIPSRGATPRDTLELIPARIGSVPSSKRSIDVEQAMLPQGGLLLLLHYVFRSEGKLEERFVLPVTWQEHSFRLGEPVQVAREATSAPKFSSVIKLEVSVSKKPALLVHRTGQGAFHAGIKLRPNDDGQFVVVERTDKNGRVSPPSRSMLRRRTGTAKHPRAVCGEQGERDELSRLRCPDGSKPVIQPRREVARDGLDPIKEYEVTCGASSRELYLDPAFCSR